VALPPGFDPRRIVIIKPSALGDVVQALPILGPLRERFPRAAISWVISKSLVELVDGHERIDDVIAFDRRGGIRAWCRLLRTLKAQQFDLVIDLQGLLRTGVMTWATRAPVRLGLETSREGAHLACTNLLRETGRDVPAWQRYRRVVEHLGWAAPQFCAANSPVHASNSTHALLPVRAADRAFAAETLRSLPRPVLGVSPGARWETKRWPASQFAALAARAHREFGAGVVIVGGPEERPLCIDLEEQLRRQMPEKAIVNLVGATTLRRLAAVLEACTWVVSNDSGPMHLADAVGTPVLGVFTCTSPRQSGPPPGRHEFVATQLACAAGYHKRCPMVGAARHACFAEIDVERAWTSFLRLLEKSRQAAA
jgi:heptosyltransferase-1